MLRALPLKDWPEADRRIWRDALRPAQRLSAGGRAAHLRASSQAVLERNYAYYLRVASDGGALNRSAAAATHVTPEDVEIFIEQAGLTRNSVSVASGVEKVRLMAQTLAPERDFGWLKNIEAQLRRAARPREKFSRMVGSEELVGAGLALMEEAREAKSGSAGQARTFRNGLIIALLAVCPIRVGSFASLTLGRSFLRIGQGWWIRLAANETKSGRPDERPVPGFLTPCVDEYLRAYRPTFLCAGRVERRKDGEASRGAGPEMATGPLWMAQRGQAMSLVTIKKTITQTTRQTLGVSVNPHRFRACAATIAALHASNYPHLASGLLQHVDPRVTEAHYNRASSLRAAIRYGAILDEMLCGRRG